LVDPIRIRRTDYDDEVQLVHKILLNVDYEKFPRRGNYVLFGEIESFLTMDGDVIFSVLEIKEEK
jgi:hypothetical protein